MIKQHKRTNNWIFKFMIFIIDIKYTYYNFKYRFNHLSIFDKYGFSEFKRGASISGIGI